MSTPEQRAHWRALADKAQQAFASWWDEEDARNKLRSTADTAVPALLDDVRRLELELDRKEALCEIQHKAIGALNGRVERLEAENAQLRAELRRWLEVIARTTPWEMQEPLMKYVTIQVDKKEYEEARARLKDLEERA